LGTAYGPHVRDVDLLVLNTVNASWRRRIDAATLAACLGGTRSQRNWSAHVRTFFEDVPREAMLRFMVAHRLEPRAVLETYRTLRGRVEAGNDALEGWLAELADAA
jgi:hypothetical protein